MSEDPRLEHVDVERLVAELPIAAIAELGQGALPGRQCRVCGVLKPHFTFYEAARVLHAWHEFFEETPTLDKLTKGWRDEPTEELRHERRRALGEWNRVAGSLSHARCSVIYLSARLHLEKVTAPEPPEPGSSRPYYPGRAA